MTTLNKDLLNGFLLLNDFLLNDFLLDIKAPMQVCDLVELMRKNNLTKEAEVLVQTAEKMGFDKNDIIYVNNILYCCTQDTYVYDCDGDRDYFESHGDGTYSYSYTDRISQLDLIDSDKRAQDLCIPYDGDNYLYVGIILG